MEHLVYGEKRGQLVIAFSIILIIAFIIFLIKKYDKMNRIVIIASSMVLGGGIGNLIDRIVRGYVIDYIDINYLFKYPIFNLADIFIVIGIILIIVSLLLKKQESQ